MTHVARSAMQAVMILAAIVAATAVQAQGGRRGPFLVRDARCPPQSFPMGQVGFRNVGRNDRGEGAATFIRIRLCSFRPNLPLLLVGRRSDCPGRIISRTRFQNVANSDFNEGAPNMVRLALCQTGPLRRAYEISTRGCPPGLRARSVVRFKNVGNNDFNEGAPNFVTVGLCAGFR
ncbi:MAG TPA: hypothetical protein VM325_20490 [Alphaproteobacteria bacterium]|jgi:hypothetical protein|nr:hypothetical protein [Alphaproteobacteria bacterium]